MRRRIFYAIELLVGVSLIVGSLTTASGQEFYSGKTIRFVVGASAGGGFDVYTRTIARQMGKYIPGTPTIIVENMPGAGGLIAANFLYNRAKPDGLTVGNWAGALILQQALGQKGFEFDSRKFEWIGVPGPDYEACVLAKTSGVTTIDEWMTTTKPLRLGGLAPGTSPSDIPRLLNAVLGLPLQVIDGYKGTSEIRLAVEAGELAGGCWAPDVIRNYWHTQLANGDVNIVVQANAKKHPQLQNVPNAIDYAKTIEDRQLIQVAIHNTEDVLRSYSLPPGTPKERVKILREAFMATTKDPAFLAEAQKANLIIDPLPGESLAKLVAEFFELKPDLLVRLKKILTPK